MSTVLKPPNRTPGIFCDVGRASFLSSLEPESVSSPELTQLPKPLSLGRGVSEVPNSALTGAARWVGHCPTNRRVTGSVPGQGTLLDCRPEPGPRLGACMRQPIDASLAHECVSPSFPPSLPLSQKIDR